ETGTVASPTRLDDKFTSTAPLVPVLRETVAVVAGFTPSATSVFARTRFNEGPSSSVTVNETGIPSLTRAPAALVLIQKRTSTFRVPSSKPLFTAATGKLTDDSPAGIVTSDGTSNEPGLLLSNST